MCSPRQSRHIFAPRTHWRSTRSKSGHLRNKHPAYVLQCPTGRARSPLQEPLSTLIDKSQSFQRYLFGEDLLRPELQSLFESSQYLEAAAGVCGEDHPIIQRVQLNLIIMMPGQDLPMHYDLPWFKSKQVVTVSC